PLADAYVIVGSEVDLTTLGEPGSSVQQTDAGGHAQFEVGDGAALVTVAARCLDRKSTRLNSSHVKISYAVFCLNKKKTAARSPATGPLPPSCLAAPQPPATSPLSLHDALPISPG